jgi:hypothetical protein
LSLHDINSIRQNLNALFANIAWAEEEISAAQDRHPEATDQLQRSFTVLAPTLSLMRIPAVYRAHCRELLERVSTPPEN